MKNRVKNVSAGAFTGIDGICNKIYYSNNNGLSITYTWLNMVDFQDSKKALLP